MTSPSKLLQRAKLGDPTAIANLINHLLQDKGLSATVEFTNHCLLITLEGESVPDPEKAAQYIDKILSHLELETITQITLCGQQKGSNAAAWTHQLKQHSQPGTFWRALPAASMVETANQTAEQLKRTASEITAATTSKAAEIMAANLLAIEQIKTASTATTQQGFAALHQAFNEASQDWGSYATAMGTSGLQIADALKDLPKTVEALAKDMPKIAQRLRYRSGLRIGDAPRSDADVMQLFGKIPGSSKLGASETKIREFLADKHGSHVIPRQQGGSNDAHNILWEVGTDNIRRGAAAISGNESIYIRFYNAVDSICKNSATVASLGITATGTAILTQTLVTATAYALDLYRGEITVEEFRDRVVEAAVCAGISTPVCFLLLVAVLALFPELTVLFAAPAVVAGFNALLGISIALPIIQSIFRHVDAGGLGEEIRENSRQAVTETQTAINYLTEQITKPIEDWRKAWGSAQ